MAAPPDHAASPVDVLVIGGGLAGSAAATRALELGCSVLLVEQGASPRYRCNSRSSGGIFHVAYHDMKLPAAELADAIIKASGGAADPGQVGAIATNAGRLINWLSAHGTRFMKASAVDWHRWTAAPPRPLRPGLDFPGHGIDAVIDRLSQAIADMGGTIALGHRAVGLERGNDGRITVLLERHGSDRLSVSAGAVIIADGGFQADHEMLRSHICRRPERLVQRNAGSGRGDGIRLAQSMGGILTRADRFYGHVLSRSALHNDALWPYPQLDALACAGIVVGPDGRRFTDEGRGGVHLANALARLDDPASAFAIVDTALWESVGRETLYPANPHVEMEDGTVLRASTIAELASRVGLPAEALAETVALYNEAARAEAGTPPGPPRSGRLRPLMQAPFLALPLAAGITHTMGGIGVDGAMRVLDRQGAPITGLFAAGTTTGGLEGGDRVVYVGGLVKAGVMGLIAAEKAAGALRKASLSTPPRDAESAPVKGGLPPERPPPYRLLRMTARHGPVASALIAAAAACLAAAFAAGSGALLATCVFLLVGATGYLGLRIFCELVALICDVLLPPAG